MPLTQTIRFAAAVVVQGDLRQLAQELDKAVGNRLEFKVIHVERYGGGGFQALYQWTEPIEPPELPDPEKV